MVVHVRSSNGWGTGDFVSGRRGQKSERCCCGLLSPLWSTAACVCEGGIGVKTVRRGGICAHHIDSGYGVV